MPTIREGPVTKGNAIESKLLELGALWLVRTALGTMTVG